MLKSVTTHAAMTIIKTWSNSWTTSARFHDGKLVHCCFGCLAKDDIEHYLPCSPLWKIVADATGVASPDDTLGRLCINASNKTSILNLQVASGTYHTMKFQYIEEVRSAAAINEWTPLLEIASEVAMNLARICGAVSLAPGHIIARDIWNLARDSTASEAASTGGSMMESTAIESAPAGVTTPRAQTTGAQSTRTEDYCEPECSDMPDGMHHPSCVIFLLNVGSEPMLVEEDGDGDE